MKPWEIWTADVGHAPHPVVILSNAGRCASAKPELVILSCTSHRAARAAERHEVIMDEADGLDWPTLCRCDLLYTVRRDQLQRRRGLVTPARRRELARQIVQALALAEL